MAFYGCMYGHIAKTTFFIDKKTKDFLPNYLPCKKQRISNQIIKIYGFWQFLIQTLFRLQILNGKLFQVNKTKECQRGHMGRWTSQQYLKKDQNWQLLDTLLSLLSTTDNEKRREKTRYSDLYPYFPFLFFEQHLKCIFNVWDFVAWQKLVNEHFCVKKIG